MRARSALAVLVFAPFVALAQAQAPSPPAPEASRPGAEWSFGAGASFQLVELVGGSTIALPVTSVSVPAAAASLERRVSDRTWLVLGATGMVSRNREDVPEGEFGVARDDFRQLSVSAGVRRPITRASAPVEVSAVVLAEAGVMDGEVRIVSIASDTRQDVTAWLAGGSVGIAVDRELTGGLALRVASPLLGATYSRGRIAEAGQPVRTSSDLSVRALLAPRLELRLAF